MNDIWNIRKKYFLNILKSIFISFEFLVTIIFFIIYFLKIIEFDKIGYFLFHDYDIVKWATFGFPIALFWGAMKFQKVLLQPEDNNKVLYNWSEYKNYRVTTYIGIIFCLLPILYTLISWARFSYYCTYDIGFYYILFISISSISVASLYISQYEIKRILQK